MNLLRLWASTLKKSAAPRSIALLGYRQLSLSRVP